MSNHTPEPWYWHENDSYCEINSERDGQIGDSCASSCLGDIDLGRANAARIITCVNACAGMEDPAAEIDELKQQRDELLDALRSAVETIEWMHGCSSPASDEVEEAIREGNATIAKAKGGEK